jgi:hypothetical protein
LSLSSIGSFPKQVNAFKDLESASTVSFSKYKIK